MKLNFSKIKLKSLLFQSAFALTFTSGLSYVFGFLRDRFMAQTFGVSGELDLYNSAFVVPDIILAVLVTTSVSTALIPIFQERKIKGNKEASDYFYNVLCIISGIVFVLVVLTFFMLPYMTNYLVAGFSQDQKEKYVILARIMLISPLLFTFSNFFGGVLVATKRLFFYGIAPVFYNIGIIIGILIFVPKYGVFGLGIGAILGAFLHFFVRFIIGFRQLEIIRKNPFYIDKFTKKTFKLMLPKIFQIGAWQILLWWFTFLATFWQEGSVTVYSIARNFQSMPVSLIGIAIALSAFSVLSTLAAEKKIEEFQKTMNNKLKFILLITTLSAIFVAFFAKLGISILFGGGAFDAEAIDRVASVLMIYALSIPLESMMHLLARGHYALKHTLRPSFISIFSIFLTIIISWIFRDFGVYIIPISFAIGLIFQDILLYLSYKKLIKKL